LVVKKMSEIPDFMWCFAVPKCEVEVNRLIKLTSTDQYYFDHRHKRQSIALRFDKMLDPFTLCRGLHSAISLFPKVGSRVVLYEGTHHFNLEIEQIKLHLVMVEPEFMSNVFAWRDLFYYLSKKQDDNTNILFQSFLMRCTDPSMGCVLISGFDHSLGDASSYAMFLSKWSDSYSEIECEAQHSINTDLPIGIISETVFKETGGIPPCTNRPQPRRYEFSADMLAAVKAEVRRDSGEGDLSINDILMAQVMLRYALCARLVGVTFFVRVMRDFMPVWPTLRICPFGDGPAASSNFRVGLRGACFRWRAPWRPSAVAPDRSLASAERVGVRPAGRRRRGLTTAPA
jgi:hypothetical protein